MHLEISESIYIGVDNQLHKADYLMKIINRHAGFTSGSDFADEGYKALMAGCAELASHYRSDTDIRSKILIAEAISEKVLNWVKENPEDSRSVPADAVLEYRSDRQGWLYPSPDQACPSCKTRPKAELINEHGQDLCALCFFVEPNK